MTDETKHRLHTIFSDVRVWLAIAYFALVWTGVAVVVDYNHSSTALNNTRALAIQRNAEEVASRNARIAACLLSIPALRKVDLFLESVRVFHAVVAANALAALNATSLSSPDYSVRLRNYQRLRRALPLTAKIRFHIPTAHSCRK